jgi:uncharacterized protein (TIGR00251 family)
MWEKALAEGPDGTYIDLDVSPGSGSQAFRGYDEWRKRIKISVRAEARDGRANSELTTFLGKILKVPPRRISITSGQTTNQKRVFVEGLGKEKMIEHLGEVIGPE